MRKQSLRWMAVILPALALLSGCRNEEFDVMPEYEAVPSEEVQGHEMIITADLVDETLDTRTSSELVEGGKTRVYWSPGDKIKVFSAGESSVFTSQNTVPSRTAKFKGTVSMIFGDDGEGETDYIWGLYPNRADATYSEPAGSSATALITTTLPAVQQGKEDSFADETFITIGRSAESLRIPFKGVCTGVYITFENDTDIDYVSLKGQDGEVLAGRFTAGMNEGADGSLTPYIESVPAPKTEVFVKAPDGGTFKKDKMYYIITLPVKFTRGFSLTAHKTTGEVGSCSITPATAPEFKVNAIGSVKKLDNRISNWALPTVQQPDEIWYTTTDGSVAEYTVDGVTGNEVVYNTYRSSRGEAKGVIKFSSPLSEIDEYAMHNQANLASVSLPDCVVKIGDSAFEECTSLSEIYLGSGLEEIGPWAFSFTNLGDIDFLPEGLKYIYHNAFDYCESITRVVIPDSVEKIGEDSHTILPMGNPFSECPNIRSFSGNFATDDGRALVETVNGKTYLISYATASSNGGTYVVPEVDVISFWACSGSSFGQVVLPESLTAIQQYAFSSCGSLTSVTIPSGVTEVGGRSFSHCKALKWVKIKSSSVPSTMSIPGYTVYDNMFFGSSCPIYVPATLIDSYKTASYWSDYSSRYQALAEDYEIMYVTNAPEPLAYDADKWNGVNSGVNYVKTRLVSQANGKYTYAMTFDGPISKIPDYAFFDRVNDNTTLVSVFLPESLTEIGENAFTNCVALGSVSFGNSLQAIKMGAFYGCPLTSLTLPESMTALGDEAFSKGTFTSVNIPLSLTTVSGNPFKGCKNLASFTGYNPLVSADGRYLVDANGKMICFAGGGLTEYTVPGEVKTIGFESMRGFDLEKVVFSEGVEVIQNQALSYSDYLQEVTIPMSVTSVGRSAFAPCSSLKKIIMKGSTPPTIPNGSGTIVSSETLEDPEFVIEIPGAGAGFYTSDTGSNRWYELKDHFKVYQADSEIWIHSIGNSTDSYYFIGDFTGDGEYDYIHQYSFFVKTGETVLPLSPTIDIPQSIINEYGEDLKIIVYALPSGNPITRMPEYGLSDEHPAVSGLSQARNVDYVSLPLTASTIAMKAFKGCSNLLVAPFNEDYIVSIGDEAFHGCSGMKWLEEEPYGAGNYRSLLKLVSIGARAFKGCTSLNHAIGRYGSGWTIGDSAFEDSSLPGIYTNCLSDLGKSAFRNCTGLDSGNVIGGTLTEIKDSTFAYCRKLEVLRLLDGCRITSIGNYAFFDDISLKTVGSATGAVTGVVTFPDVVTVKRLAFYECYGIEEMHLPEMTTVDESAFSELGSRYSSPVLRILDVPKLSVCYGGWVAYNFAHIIIDELFLPSITDLGNGRTFGYAAIGAIHFGPGLTNFPAWAFVQKASDVETVLYFEGTTPPVFDARSFLLSSSSSELVTIGAIHVPSGYEAAYKTALTNANALYSTYADKVTGDL